MKNLIIALTLVLSAFSCEKKNNIIEAKILRNCTGVYLQVKDENFHVCNMSKLKKFEDGAMIKVAFKKTDECKGEASEVAVCMMLFAGQENWIEVVKVY